MSIYGSNSAVMEVTSHALDQQRVAFIDYDVAIFTNLTLDHLDYHQTMERYCEAKNKLFCSLGADIKRRTKVFPKVAVVNVDSPWIQQIIKGCQAKTLSYGIENAADLKASNIQLTSEGTTFDVTYQENTVTCFWPLIGRHNIYNGLAAMAVGLIRGAPLETVVQLAKEFPAAPGRLEPVPNALGLNIYIDFAHTDDALTNVLESLQELKKGKIITVFGCGGDRDREKRPKMAQVAEELSDIAIVTSDNPRCEEPEAICDEIITGFKDKTRYELIIDRKDAIQRAIDLANPEDIILIAGKGHEKFQVFAFKTVEFDDRKVAIELCKEKAKAQV